MKKCETKTEKHYERGGYKHKQGQIKLLHFAKELARLFDPLILLILFSFFLFVFHDFNSKFENNVLRTRDTCLGNSAILN
jgi:hypothetical protein